MKVIRDREYVNSFHFDMRNFKMEEEHGTPKTQYNVEFHLVEKMKRNNQQPSSWSCTL